MKTLLEVLNSGADYLERQGCDEPRIVMQHLMGHVLQCNRTTLYTHFDRLLSEEELTPLRALIKRKAAGEPLQHILGSVEFYRREFLSDSRALVPRPETEELVELVLARTAHLQPPLRILDMGTGTGVIGITLALELAKQVSDVVLADISPAALSLALDNAMRLKARVSTVQTDLFGAWTTALHAEEEMPTPPRFDLIVANLPYIPDGEPLQREVHFDPSSALYGGKGGLDIIHRFLNQAPAFLNENALIALETGIGQDEEIARILHKNGYRDIEILRDLNGIARFPLARAPLTAREHPCTPPES